MIKVSIKVVSGGYIIEDNSPVNMGGVTVVRTSLDDAVQVAKEIIVARAEVSQRN